VLFHSFLLLLGMLPPFKVLKKAAVNRI